MICTLSIASRVMRGMSRKVTRLRSRRLPPGRFSGLSNRAVVVAAAQGKAPQMEAVISGAPSQLLRCGSVLQLRELLG